MGITGLTRREFNQDAARAKKAALAGPVFITDRGRSAHVLLSIDEYQRLTGRGAPCSMPSPDGIVEIQRFEPAKLSDVSRIADLG